MKYRIKLNSDRTVGPLSIEQVGQLYENGHIDGTESCQLFPRGDWKKISEFKEINDILVKVMKGEYKKSDLHEGVTLKRLAPKSVPDKDRATKAGFVEFQFDTNKKDETIELNLTEKTATEVPIELNEEPEVTEEEIDKKENEIEKTLLIRKQDINDVLDKTIVHQDHSLKNALSENNVEEQKQELKKSQKSKEEKEDESLPAPRVDLGAETVVLNLKEDLPEIKQEVKKMESRLSKLKSENTPKQEMTKVQKISSTIKSKKTFTPIITIVVVAIMGLLLFEEEEKPDHTPIPITFQFPLEGTQLNKNLKKSHYTKGINLLRVEKYLNKVNASTFFLKSLNNGFQNNPSMGLLIRTYAELLEDSRDYNNASRVIFKLIELTKSKQHKDIDVAVGAAIFFNKREKYYASQNILENYLRISSKPSLTLLSVYMNNFIDMGNIKKAREVFDRIKNIPNKNLYTYLTIYKFHTLDERKSEALAVLKEALKKFPWSSNLKITLADYYFTNEQTKDFNKMVKVILRDGFEKSPHFYIKFLELEGLFYAINGNQEKAQLIFKKALKYRDSEELRFKLSQLEVGGIQSVQNLILESKAVQLMKLAKKNLNEGKWELALSQAIETTTIVEDYIPAHILLADIQVIRGYFSDALEGLLKLIKKYPKNSKLLYSYIDILIKSGKTIQAQKELSNLMGEQFSKTWQYAFLLAQVYEESKSIVLANKYYIEAISRAPLRDDLYFALSKLYHSRLKYKQAKYYVQKSLSLNPKNIDYHILFARLLYETETNPNISQSDAAIGYLKSLEETNPNNPKLLGEIALYYSISGQVKFFEIYKKKIEKAEVKDANFYASMLETSKSEGNFDLVQEYAKKLISLRPGDLKTRLELGEYFFNVREYAKSAEVFSEIRKRIESYPLVNYYLGKLALIKGDVEEAKKFAEKEIEYNKSKPFGYFVRGEALFISKDFKGARVDLERAISLDPNFVEALVTLGKIRAGQNYHEQAKDLFFQALQEAPNTPEVHLELARAYRNIGQNSLAVTHFTKYLELYPNAPNKKVVESIIRQIR